MCGLIGYIGKRSVVPLLLDGLKRLEYRGYDSAGGFVIDNKRRSRCLKVKGEVAFLKDKFEKNPIEGKVGIFHTRWATHGKISIRNAHPHSDCSKKIWLVHNGIIDNYQILKSKLLEKGHKFRSETDTEVLAHLIESNLLNSKISLEDAVRKSLLEVEGTYGLAVIFRDEPEKIVISRNGSPLLVGLGDGEYFTASDATPIIAHTKQIIYLKDGEIGILTHSDFKIVNLNSSQDIKKRIFHLDWDVKQTGKGGFPHFMLKEIFEQPESVENSFRGRLIVKEGLAKLGGLEAILIKLRKIKKLVITACGTSYHAGLVGKYMLEEYANLPTEVEISSEFRYRKPILDKSTALLVISQSGETADALGALREAKTKGIPVLGLTNVVGSSIGRESDAGIYNHIGSEISVASTKAFTSQLTILVLLTLFFGRQRQMSLAIGQEIVKGLKKLPSQLREILKQSERIKKIARKYYRLNNIIYLGRKYNFPIAQEGALKLKEISYIPVQSYASGEMKHGPIATVDGKTLCIFILPVDSLYERNLSNLEEIKARGAKIIVITTERNRDLENLADEIIYIPKSLEILVPILSIVPLQLFAYYVALLRGCSIDKPRNLAKSVTVE